MAAAIYALGQIVRVTGVFTQSAVALDPTIVAVTVRRPDGIQVTKTYGTDSEVVKASTGTYYMDYTPVIGGQHWYRWISTGVGQSAGEDRFVVTPSRTTE